MPSGIIVNMGASPNSGLAILYIENDETNKVDLVYCENAPTVRALDQMFGDIIWYDHTVNMENLRGKRVVYELDSTGQILAWIGSPDEEESV